MSNNTKLNEKVPEKNQTTTETPIMTEDEMKSFISVLANNERLDHVYTQNGFLFFFHSIYKVIKKNPVDALNLMTYLQEHVFHKMMWESFYAFDKQRAIAHLIYSSTEPYIHENETDVVEQPNTESADEDTFDERERHYNQIWANKISYVLASPDVSPENKNAVLGILSVIANEANTGFYDEPEVIKIGFPLQMEKLSSEERRAYIHSIDSMLESILKPEVYKEIEKMFVRFEDRTQRETPLDLSEMSADSLNTDDRKTENRRTAECLSEILNNQNMPVELRNGILAGLQDVFEHDLDAQTEIMKFQQSPEYIETLLSAVNKEEQND